MRLKYNLLAGGAVLSAMTAMGAIGYGKLPIVTVPYCIPGESHATLSGACEPDKPAPPQEISGQLEINGELISNELWALVIYTGRKNAQVTSIAPVDSRDTCYRYLNKLIESSHHKTDVTDMIECRDLAANPLGLMRR